MGALYTEGSVWYEPPQIFGMIHPSIRYDPTRYSIWSTLVFDAIHPGIRCDPPYNTIVSTQVFDMIQTIIRYDPPGYSIWYNQVFDVSYCWLSICSYYIIWRIISYSRVDRIEYLVGSYRIPGWIASKTWLDHIEFPGGSYRIPGWIISNFPVDHIEHSPLVHRKYRRSFLQREIYISLWFRRYAFI